MVVFVLTVLTIALLTTLLLTTLLLEIARFAHLLLAALVLFVRAGLALAQTKDRAPEAGLIAAVIARTVHGFAAVGFRQQARLVSRCETGHESDPARTRAARIGGVRIDDPPDVDALAVDLQRRGRQAREQPRPHPHRAGGAIQAGGGVLIVAHPDHGQVIAGPARKPAVAAVVAGAGLAGGLQPTQAVAHQLAAGAGRYRLLQRRGHQPRADGIAGLCGFRRIVITVERLAVGIEHAAHRMQRLDFAAGREELVQLRHRVRALIQGTQNQRRILAAVDAGQRPQQIGKTLRPHVHAHSHRRLVVGLRQGIDQAHRAMAAAVGIAGVPALAVVEGDADRRVVDGRGQRIFVRLRQRQQIHERFEQRPHRTLRLHRAVEAVLFEGTAADHRHHFAAVHIRDHHAGLQRRAARGAQRFHRTGHRAFGVSLRGGRHAGEHGQAGTLQFFFGIIARQLAAHQIDIRRKAIRDHASRHVGHTQRRLDRAVVFLLIDDAGLQHLRQHPIAPHERAFRIAPRVVPGRPFHHAHQQRDMFGGQIVELTAEVELCPGSEAVNGLRTALADIHLIEVRLQNHALFVAGVDNQRKQNFVELAGVSLFLADAQQTGTRELLGQRTGTLLGLAA